MKRQDYEDIRESKDSGALERALVSFAQKMDFEIVTAAVAVERPGASTLFKAIGNVPSGFVETSRSANRVDNDPVHKLLKRASIPFGYDQALYVNAGAGDLWEEQAAWGFKTGIAIAQHLPDGRHFLLGVDRSEPLPKDESQLMRMFADLQLASVYAQEASNRLLIGDPTPSQPLENLTPREVEVLKWTREGKSAWTVGQILKISEQTVNNHLRNACQKLEVTSKHVAVLKAIALQLL